uniref:Receptor ligand binding region domain-containing protein n=1 Tax=Hucho hucho TaxID=62062 RepID=A0A4W5K453_9TELE
MGLWGWLGLLYCLHVPGSVWGLDGGGQGACRLTAKPVSGSVYRAGDVVIGGLFPIHVEAPLPEQDFKQRAYRWLQTMIFAVEEINRDPALLPNLTLGFLASDTCRSEGTTLGAALAMVTGQEASVVGTECGTTPEVPVIIGDARSSASIVVAQTLGPFDLPMVRQGLDYSDNWKYPSFFRTVPSDAFQARGLAKLLRLQSWVWVGLVSEDDDYGKFGVQLLLQELQGSGVCVAYSEVLPKLPSKRKIRHIVDTIRESTARVVVLDYLDLFNGFILQALMEEVVRQNITDKQWIASEAWVTYSTIAAPKNLPSLAGTIGFALKKADIPGLGTFLTRLHPDGDYQKSDPFLRELWEEMFGCSLGVDLSVTLSSRRQCVGESQYADVSQLRASYNVYKAVYAIAYAIQDMVACRPGDGVFNGGQCPDIRKLQPSQVTIPC